MLFKKITDKSKRPTYVNRNSDVQSICQVMAWSRYIGLKSMV